jgi:hypothetical protein
MANRRAQIPPPADLVPPSPLTKPSIGVPDPYEAYLEELMHAKEGNLKLQHAIEVLRSTLETIVVAEFDNRSQLPVSAQELRTMAAEGLNEYSRLTGQNWRRHKLIGSRVGDRSPVQDEG